MSNWLKKSVLTAAAFLSMQAAFSQVYEYDINAGWLIGDIGEIVFDKDQRKLTVDITRFKDISMSYELLNDSTYVELNKVNDLSERYIYVKRDSLWSLDEYVVLAGKSLFAKDSLDEAVIAEKKRKIKKDSLVGTVYDSTLLSPLDSFDKFFNGNPYDKEKDSLNVVIFGEPYIFEFNKDDSHRNKVEYLGRILPYMKSEDDAFLLGDEIEFSRKKVDSTYVINSIDGETKVGIFNVNIKVRPKDD